MRSLFANLGLASAALVLALLSSEIERTGPELAQYGNLCGASYSEACMKPVLNAGFPFPYLFDAPGVSVEGKLSFVEDRLRPIPLLGDVAVYIAVSLLIVRGFTLRSSAK
jgi:hypothetical protein